MAEMTSEIFTVLVFLDLFSSLPLTHDESLLSSIQPSLLVSMALRLTKKLWIRFKLCLQALDGGDRRKISKVSNLNPSL
jgi:hypothetical protein